MNHSEHDITLDVDAERARFVSAMAGEADVHWDADAGEFTSELTKKLWVAWKRSALVARDHWVPFPAFLPEICGHYDAWDPKEGRFADAYFEDGHWFTEYDGERLHNITHFNRVFIPPTTW